LDGLDDAGNRLRVNCLDHLQKKGEF